MPRWLMGAVLAVGLAQTAYPSVCLAALLPLNDLPSEVLLTIEELNNGVCTDKKLSQTDINAGAVQKVDLNEDGYPDYIINDSYFPTGEMLTCRHGAHGGVGIVIFAGTPSGSVIKAFDKTVWNVTVEESPPAIWVSVGGGYCGQTDNVPFVAAIRCERKLVWVEKTKEFDFAPLSEARFAPPKGQIENR